MLTSLLFQSCDLEPNPAGSRVTPQVLNEDGFTIEINYNFNNISASIGNYPVVMPDNNGFCSFENVPAVYDFNVIAFDRSNEHYRNCYLFKNVTRTNPVIILKPSFLESTHNAGRVLVHFPPISDQRIGIIKFISKDFFSQYYDEAVVEEHSDRVYVTVYFPVYENSISGKLLFFQCKGEWNSGEGFIQIEQFDKYGSKDIVIKNGETEDVTFTPPEVNNDPPESSVNYSITIPPYVPQSITQIQLNFDGYNSNSLLTIGKHYDPTQTNSVVPASLDIPFSVRVTSEFYHYFGDFMYSKSLDIPPGGSCNIVYDEVNPVSPADNQKDVNLNSNLEVSDNNFKGIYIFILRNYTSETLTDFHLVTDMKKLKLWELNNRSFSVEPNSDYFWYVVRLGDFNSIDEFIEKPFITNTMLTSSAISRPRIFYTGNW